MSRLVPALALALATAGAALAQHTAKVHAVAFSPGGKLLVSGGEDGRLVTWDARTGRRIAETRVGRRPWPIRDLAFAPQGDWLVAGGGDRVKVFRAGAAKPRLELSVPRAVAAVAFGPFLRLAHYSTSGEAAVRGALNGTLYRRSQLPEGQVWAAAYSPDASVVALGSDADQVVRLVQAATGEVLREAKARFSSSISALAFSPDGSKLAVGSYDKRIRVFSTRTGEQLAFYAAHRGPVYALAFSPDGALLASGAKAVPPTRFDEAGSPHALVLQTWQGERRASRDVGFTVEALAFSPDGATLAFGGESRQVHLWRLGSRTRGGGGDAAGAPELPSVQ